MKLRLLAVASSVALLGALAAQGTAQAGKPTHGAAQVAGAAAGKAPDCRLSQLRLHNGPRVSEKTQQETEIFVLHNISTRRCALDGYPVVSLWTSLSPHGRLLPFRYRDHGDQMLTSARPHRVVLPARGGNAYFGINKNTCVGRATGTARFITVFPLGQLHVKLHRHPVLGYCGRHDPGHVVDISPYEPTVRAVLARH